MGLKKGMCNNPAGRPPGKPNKVSGELRERLKTFLDQNWLEVEKEFKRLDPDKKLFFYEKLIGYAIPKLRESDLKIDFTKLSDSDMNKIIDKLISND